MRILVHNVLVCHAKSCRSTANTATDSHASNFPLRLADVELSHESTEYNPDFLRHQIPLLQWPAIHTAAFQLGNTKVPETLPEGWEQNEDFLMDMHQFLLEVNFFFFLSLFNASCLYHLVDD